MKNNLRVEQVENRDTIHEIKEYLLREGHEDGTQQDEPGMTALMLAAGQGRLDMVKEFCKLCSGELDRRNHRGWTALNFAAAMGHVDIVRYLLERGARLEAADYEAMESLKSVLRIIWPNRHPKCSSSQA